MQLRATLAQTTDRLVSALIGNIRAISAASELKFFKPPRHTRVSSRQLDNRSRIIHYAPGIGCEFVRGGSLALPPRRPKSTQFARG